MSSYALQDRLNELAELLREDNVLISRDSTKGGLNLFNARLYNKFPGGYGSSVGDAINELYHQRNAEKSSERVKKLKPGDRFTLAPEPPFRLNQRFVVVEVGPLVVIYDPLDGPAYRRQQATLDWAADHFTNMETPTGWEPVE